MASYSEAMRRLYSDLIWRRSRVRIATAVEPSLTCEPVFLIGLYRSGTTLLRYVLDSHSNLACPPESAFLTHLEAMHRDQRSRTGLESLGFDDEHVLARMRIFAAYFFESYAASRQKGRWIDKSPGYVDHLDFLQKLFPSGRMLMIFRHPLDQIHSAVQKGTIPVAELAPYVSDNPSEDRRIVHARYWSEKAGKMHAYCQRNDYPCHSLHYEELCRAPEQSLMPVFDFLGEPWEQQVLHFYEADHDRGNEDGRTGATRGFAVSEGAYQEWPHEIRQQCWKIVEPVARQLGYAPVSSVSVAT